MLTVPLENYCRFCQKLFCCAKCRSKHEESIHSEEIETLKKEEILVSQCYICNGLPLPFSYKEKLTADMMDHVAKYHLPLQCDKCLKRFETIDDFAMLGKCCKPNEKPEEVIEVSKENMGDSVNIPVIAVQEPSLKRKSDESTPEEENKQMTPLTQINIRWRRKSREYGKTVDEVVEKKVETITKTTSTPLQANFNSSLGMQISSINYMSSSSETDFSPPAPVADLKPPIPTPAVVSPKTKKSSASRQKLPVQNTPLRQLMTKSVQRAIAIHGHYKTAGIQQRRMTFDSTSSSYEQTVSLMKLQISRGNDSSQPLDLRMSPALRRDSNKKETLETEEVNIVLRRCESESSIVSSYKSCISEVIETPKVSVSNSNLKKTISFEIAHGDVEKTPAMLIPKKLCNNSDSDDDEVFFTPQATPARRFSMESGMRAMELASKLEEFKEDKKNSPKKNKFWNWVESAANYAKRSSGASSGSEKSVSPKKLSNIGMVLRRAVGYLGKASSVKSEGDNMKRPRESSSTSSEKFEEVRDKHTASPKTKKRRIQGRKPIERMRNISNDMGFDCESKFTLLFVD